MQPHLAAKNSACERGGETEQNLHWFLPYLFDKIQTIVQAVWLDSEDGSRVVGRSLVNGHGLEIQLMRDGV